MRAPVMLGVLAALVFVSGPARTATGEVRGGTIRIGMDADNTTMDPHRSTAAVDRQVYNNLYSKLVDIDAAFGIVPQLAQSWDIKTAGSPPSSSSAAASSFTTAPPSTPRA